MAELAAQRHADRHSRVEAGPIGPAGRSAALPVQRAIAPDGGRQQKLTRLAEMLNAGPQRQRLARLGDCLDARAGHPNPAASNIHAVVQRRLIVGGVSLTKHNSARLLEVKPALRDEWTRLSGEERRTLTELIESGELRGEGGTFGEILAAGASTSQTTNTPTADLPQSRTIEGPTGAITLPVINDSGGYHAILGHPADPGLIVRERKDPKATGIAEGLRNREALGNRLHSTTKGVIRVPHAGQFSRNAYAVEKVDGSVDAHAMWARLRTLQPDSPEAQVLRQRLHAIAEVFQANISATNAEKASPFPDFRPANVGEKAGHPELIYIDFDQRSELTDHATLADHAREWAGQRFERDPGGARAPDPALYNFVTSGQLGELRGGATPLRTDEHRSPEYDRDERSPDASTSTSSQAPTTQQPAPGDTLPLAQILEGNAGGGGLRIHDQDIPPSANLAEGQTIIVGGAAKIIEYISHYQGVTRIDYLHH
jgi:hypothetical protein